MAYRALYREWRPKDFSHVVGQKAIIDTLRNQVITQRIAHAYLFCGSRGTGKTSTAKILAKAINCLNPENGDPCGKCENCLRADQEETLDIIEIDAASNNGVDEIRNLRDTVKYPPQYGNYKVYIIDEVHMLSAAAFNALLKTLEEPPAHIVFILATTEPQKLPETILSRCQRFDFGRIPVHEIAGRLKEAAESTGAYVSDGALMLISRTAEGGMRDALSLLDMCLGYSDKIDETLVRTILGTSDTNFLFHFCKSISENDAGSVFIMIDQLMKEGKDPSVFAKDVCRHIRSLLVAKTSPDDVGRVMDITEEEASELISQSENFTLTRLMKILDLFMSLEAEMRYSSTPRIALENASIKCCLKTSETDSQALSDRITELERKIDELTEKLKNDSFKTIPRAMKQQPTEEKAKNTPGSSGVSRVKGQEPAVWKQAVALIQQKDIALWSMLSQGKIISCKDNRFIWCAERKEGEDTFISALNKPEKNRIVCECLNQVTGEECSFSAVSVSILSSNAGNSDEEYLESIYETFGREPVDVVDEK